MLFFMHRVYRFFLISLFFLGHHLAGQAYNLQLSDGVSQQVLSNQLLQGHLDLGVLTLLNPDGFASSRFDGIFALSAQNVLLPPELQGIPAGRLYVMGARSTLPALRLQVDDLNEDAVDVFVSYVGDLDLYLSEGETVWSPGMVLNGVQHVQIPGNNELTPLVGLGGRLSTDPLRADNNELTLDMAFKITPEDLAGSKSGALTFTLVAQ